MIWKPWKAGQKVTFVPSDKVTVCILARRLGDIFPLLVFNAVNFTGNAKDWEHFCGRTNRREFFSQRSFQYTDRHGCTYGLKLFDPEKDAVFYSAQTVFDLPPNGGDESVIADIREIAAGDFVVIRNSCSARKWVTGEEAAK